MRVIKDGGYAHLVDQVTTGGEIPDHSDAYICLDETARLALVQALTELPLTRSIRVEMFGESGGQYTLHLDLKEAELCQ